MAADFEVFEHCMGHEERMHEGDVNTTYAYLKERIDSGSTLLCLEVQDVALGENLSAVEWYRTMQEALVQHVVYEAMVLGNVKGVSVTAAIEATNKILEILR